MTKRALLILLALSIPVLIHAQLSGLTFCIDPGHGGYNSNDRHLVPDPGIDFYESESNFEKAVLLKQLLEAHGAAVILTRNSNSGVIYPNPSDPDEPTLAARVEVANSNNVDWFHSIHSNATGLANNTTINYTLMLVREQIVPGGDPVYGPGTGQPEWPEAWTMASLYMSPGIQGHLRTQRYESYLDWTFYGGSRGGYTLGVLRGLTMPGELSEGSMHDYFPETRRLMNNDYRRMEAYALLKSFLQYYGASSDSLGIVAGIQTDDETGTPKNGTVVRIIPENRVYPGDNYNNGFYMFDSLSPGPHTLVFDTPRYNNDTAAITVTAGGVLFLDRSLSYSLYPFVTRTSPAADDTTVLTQNAITIQFSVSMDTASVTRALSFAPAATGTITWTSDLRTLTFAAIPAFQYLTWYTVTVDSAARALNGYRVDTDGDEVGGDSVVFSFRTETALSASGISFGQIKKSDSGQVALIIRNRASYNIVLRHFSPLAPEFSVPFSLPDTVRGNDSLTMSAFFTPTSFGLFRDTLVVRSDSGTIHVLLSGSSPAPILALSHTFLGFGSVPIDTTRTRAIFLCTTSINGVRIDSIYTRSPAFQFSPSLSYPVTLELGDTLHGLIIFQPQAVSAYSDTLLVLTNAASAVSKIALIGSGQTVSAVAGVMSPLQDFALFQNFPNPFNPDTQIEYTIAETSPVRIEILNILGQSVRLLVSGERELGRYRVTWDGTDDYGKKISSGVYFCRFSAGGFVFSKKMILLK